MLAIARGLMARPKVMLLDEPSLGLSPILIRDIYSIVRRLNRSAGSQCCWWSRTSGSRSTSRISAM